MARKAGRILLVDPDGAFSSFATKVLTRHGYQVAVAGCCQEAERWIGPETRPAEAALLELVLPDGPAEQLLPKLSRAVPPCHIGVVTRLIECDRWLTLLPRCRAVVPKPLGPRALVTLANYLMSDPTVGSCLCAFATHYGLSARETEVVQLAARGFHNKEALEILGLSNGTLASYWHRVFRKTGCHSQREVFLALLRFGLALRPPPPATGALTFLLSDRP